MATPLESLMALINSNIKVSSSVVSPVKTTGHMLKEVLIALANYGGAGVPIGTVVAWPSDIIPDGWILCDGNNGTEDLRGRTIFGKNSTIEQFNTLGKAGGDIYTRLEVKNLPQFVPTGTVSEDPGHTHGLVLGFDTNNTPAGGADQHYGEHNSYVKRTVTTQTGGRHSHTLSMNPIGGNQPYDSLDPYKVLNWIQYVGYGYGPVITGGLEDIVLTSYDDYGSLNREITVDGENYVLTVSGPPDMPQLTTNGNFVTSNGALEPPAVADEVTIMVTATNPFGSDSQPIKVKRNLPPFTVPNIEFTDLDIMYDHYSLQPIVYPSGSVSVQEAHVSCILKPDTPVNQALGYTWSLKSINVRGWAREEINAFVDPKTLHIELRTAGTVGGSHNNKYLGINAKNNQTYEIVVEGVTPLHANPLTVKLEVKILLWDQGWGIRPHYFFYVTDDLPQPYGSVTNRRIGDYEGFRDRTAVTNIPQGVSVDFRIINPPTEPAPWTFDVSPTIPIGEVGFGNPSPPLPAGSVLNPNTGALKLVTHTPGLYWIRATYTGNPDDLVSSVLPTAYIGVQVNPQSESLFYGSKHFIDTTSPQLSFLTADASGLRYDLKLKPRFYGINPASYGWSATVTNKSVAPLNNIVVKSINSSTIDLDFKDASANMQGISYWNNGTYKVRVEGRLGGSTTPTPNPNMIRVTVFINHTSISDSEDGTVEMEYENALGQRMTEVFSHGGTFSKILCLNVTKMVSFSYYKEGMRYLDSRSYYEEVELCSEPVVPSDPDIVTEFYLRIALPKSMMDPSAGMYTIQYGENMTKLLDYNMITTNTNVGETYLYDFVNFGEPSTTNINASPVVHAYDFAKNAPNPTGNYLHNPTMNQDNITIDKDNGRIKLVGPLSSSTYWISFKKNTGPGGAPETMFACIKTT